MHLRHAVLVIVGGWAIRCLPGGIAAAAGHHFAYVPPACGKVCQLVCETKKLSAVCYACECEEICLPGPSRPGCKHCASCGLEPSCGECGRAGTGCDGHRPECEFCWRDWFACGCARPRTVKVLTKYEAEREIGWYHWEVVDAACGGCVAGGGGPGRACGIYKPAPEEAELGEVVAVSDEEWTELAGLLRPDDAPRGRLADEAAATSADPQVGGPNSAGVSIAERLGRLFKR
jgi:hypothetical protein